MDHGVSGQPATARPAKRRLSHFFAFALAISAAAAAPTATAPPAPPSTTIVRATPALWIIRDADTTIYLFGTFHSLDSRTVWLDRDLRAAFDRSDELVLETVAPTDTAQLRQSAANAGTATSGFIKGTRAAVAGARASGMTVSLGADSVLRRLAEQNGKKVSGLEDFTEQLKTLSSIPASVPAPAPTSAPARPVTMASLFSSWTKGDSEAFGDVLSALEVKSPLAYQTLIARRNVQWAAWIAKRLEQPGTVFVAVGSGHLAGKDSVQRVLATRGIETVRIG